jgi:hypothetical protein
MRAVTVFSALAAAPAFAHETGHAHLHPAGVAPVAVVALLGAALCGWLVARASKDGR